MHHKHALTKGWEVTEKTIKWQVELEGSQESPFKYLQNIYYGPIILILNLKTSYVENMLNLRFKVNLRLGFAKNIKIQFDFS